MTPETFIEQFETFAEAPNGVAKLRELILQLAVQGKLVPQDVNDEQSEDISDVLRTAPALALVSFSTDVAVIPASWLLARLSDLVDFSAAQKVDPDYQSQLRISHFRRAAGRVLRSWWLVLNASLVACF